MSSDKKHSELKQRSADMINAEIALKRGAIKARELAKQTVTAVVTSENGRIREEYP